MTSVSPQCAGREARTIRPDATVRPTRHQARPPTNLHYKGRNTAEVRDLKQSHVSHDCVKENIITA
eukprot:3457308-Amphidinium_carterae.1